MKKLTKTLLTTLILTTFLAAPLYAQNQGNAPVETGQGSTNSNAPENPGQVKEQVQQKTKNEGEDVQIQIQNQETVQEGTEPATEIAPGIGRKMGGRTDAAREKMSVVAQKAEELISQGAQFQGGIGEEISKVAQQQKSAVSETKEALDKVEKRKGFLKFIAGPNQQALSKLEQVREKNQERIQKLQELKNQTANQTDSEKIQEMIQTVEEGNEVLGTQIQQELESFSVFGWFRKFFSF